MPPFVSSLDHLVLTVRDPEATAEFYERILGFTTEVFRPADGSARKALKFGGQKINLHQVGREFSPKAAQPTAGSADLCFLSETSLDDWQAHLSTQNIAIEEGPVRRTGATGPILSIYIRDPDGNLLEIANRV